MICSHQPSASRQLFSLAVLLALATTAQAITEDSPYHGIVGRNVFDVHPAPPPKVPGPEDNRPPPPNIKLQGITDILGKKQVIMKVQLPGKPGATPGKDEAFILTVGQRQGEIEVLDIDVKAGTVLVNNYGVKTNLSLEANSDKLVSTGPVPGAPPPVVPNIGSPPPSAIPAPPQFPNPASGRFPARTLRLPGQPQANSVSPNNSVGVTGTVSPVTPVSPHADPNQRYTFQNAEDQALMIEAQRLKYQQEGDYRADLLPPTRLTPNQNNGQQQQSY